MEKPKKVSELSDKERELLELCKAAAAKGHNCEFPEHGLDAITTRGAHHQRLYGKDERSIGSVQLMRSKTRELVFEADFNDEGEPTRVKHGAKGERICIQRG